MIISIFDSQVLAILRQARFPHSIAVNVDGKRVEVPKPFPSPADWRDHIIYFLMVDRFNNPAAPPNHLPFDEAFDRFQGGALKGIQE